MRQFATYFPATQRQNLPDKTSRFGKTSFPSPLQSVAERLLISFAPLNCCYHIINKLSLCQPIYRTKVHFLKIVQTTHTFSRFIDYQLFKPYILNTITVISLLTAKTRLYRRFFFGGAREHSPFSENGRVYSHSGACNGEFGGVAVSRNQVMIVRENLSVEATKNPTETSGFFGGAREHSPYSENGRVYSHSGACNREFGGAAVSYVAHFAFEIALSGATMLTFLLVCSFSPRVHSIPRGPL